MNADERDNPELQQRLDAFDNQIRDLERELTVLPLSNGSYI